MILIISSQEDFSTHEVIDWLLFYQHPFVRISSQDFLETLKACISAISLEITFELKGKTYYLSDFQSVWYRRSWISPNYVNEYTGNKSIIQTAIQNQILSEKKVLFELLQYNLYERSINSPFRCNLNPTCYIYPIKCPKMPKNPHGEKCIVLINNKL